MEIKHEHVEIVLLAWAAEVGQAYPWANWFRSARLV